jgi:hypothetical protein
VAIDLVGPTRNRKSVKDIELARIKSDFLVPDYFDKYVIPNYGDYYADGVDFYNLPRTLCPLHNESTPSFNWYSDSNTFYCFGCQSGGDIITLHQRVYESLYDRKPTFPEALAFLKALFAEDLSSAESGSVSHNHGITAGASSDADRVTDIDTSTAERKGKALRRLYYELNALNITSFDEICLCEELARLSAVDVLSAEELIRG